jgi:hypothetical protein
MRIPELKVRARARTKDLLSRVFSPQRLARAAQAALMLLLLVSIAVLAGCKKSDNKTRSKDCTPPEWNDPKWQNVKEGQQLLTRAYAESAYAKERSKIIAPYWTPVEIDPSYEPPVVRGDGSELRRGALILGGREALAGYEHLFDEEALSRDLESRIDRDRTGFEEFSFEAFLEKAAPSNDETLDDDSLADLAADAVDELPSGTEPKLLTSGEPVAQIRAAVLDAHGNPGTPVRYTSSAVVALNIHCVDGTPIRATGFLAANRVVVTVGHIMGQARAHGGIESIEILPPSGPSAATRAPAAIPALAYQVEPAYSHPNGADDVMLLYFQGALPARAQPHSPVVNYESALGCQNPGNCTAQNVFIEGTRPYDNTELDRPQIRRGQAVISYQEQQGNSQWLYLYPPIVEYGDSGSPVYIDGQIVGIVWGTWPIPINYAGQAHPTHMGTVVQVLDGQRLQTMMETFENNVRTLIANNQHQHAAPWRTDDHRFGILRDYQNPGPNNQYWTQRTLANALAAFLFYSQFNPPQGGCNHP